MASENKERNLTVQGVGSPVPASVRGEHAGPGTSTYSDRNTHQNEAMGVAHLAPMERNATSENRCDPFSRGSKLARTPPPAAKTPAGIKQATVGKPSPRRSILQENEGAHVNAAENSDFLSTEIQNCCEIIKTMKSACNKQRNISMDIKNGIAALEESIDKIKWNRTRKKKADQSSQTSALRPPTASSEASHQKNATGQEKEPKSCASAQELAMSTTKRPPTSPLHKGLEKRTRKTSQDTRAVAREQRGCSDEINRGKESYAQALINEKSDIVGVGQRTKDREKSEQGQRTKARKKSEQSPTENKKKEKRRERRRARPEAILIKPKGTEKFSDVLREMRSKANPDDTETVVKNVRQTKSGHVLVELGEKTKDKKAFGESLKSILGDMATVQNLVPKAAIEVRDLDELTTVEEVEEAVRKKLPDVTTDIQVAITGKNRSSLKMAIVQISVRAANELLKSSRIKIGWVQCRIRRRVEVKRCFKCFGYGHKQSSCTSIDRKGQGLCINCGEKGHKKKECKNPSKCCLCADLETTPPLNHVPGTGNCQVFRKALEQTKKASSK